MSNTLFDICEAKREYLKGRKSVLPESIVMARAKQATPARGFQAVLKQKADKGEMALIAEVKKASPSEGVIREDFSPAAIAQAYEAGGASCISVLTDEPYFQGKDEYLTQVRAAVKLPVLRKDFIIDPYQVYESRMLGADCVLLIMAALPDRLAGDLESIAHSLHMDVLVEVHDVDELNRALRIFRSTLIGVNNRNLRTLEVDLAAGEALAARIPQGYLRVCESGIKTHADMVRMKAAGYPAFLVGSRLMDKPDIKAATAALLNG